MGPLIGAAGAAEAGIPVRRGGERTERAERTSQFVGDSAVETHLGTLPVRNFPAW